MFQEPSASNDGVGGLIDNLRVVAPYQEALAAVNLTKGSIYPWAISGGAGDKIYVALEMFPREPLPTFTYVSAEYASEVDALNLDGTQYISLLASNEAVGATNIVARLDWSKLTWDINGDNATTANVQFLASDILTAIVISNNNGRVTLTSAKAAALEATKGYGGATTVSLGYALAYLPNGSAYGAADVNPLYVALQVIGAVTTDQLVGVLMEN